MARSLFGLRAACWLSANSSTPAALGRGARGREHRAGRTASLTQTVAWRRFQRVGDRRDDASNATALPHPGTISGEGLNSLIRATAQIVSCTRGQARTTRMARRPQHRAWAVCGPSKNGPPRSATVKPGESQSGVLAGQDGCARLKPLVTTLINFPPRHPASTSDPRGLLRFFHRRFAKERGQCFLEEAAAAVDRPRSAPGRRLPASNVGLDAKTRT
jgi:hypothetical protein